MAQYILQSLDIHSKKVSSKALPQSGRGSVKAKFAMQYLVIDEATNRAPKKLELKKKGKNLIIEVDGEIVGTIQGFYEDSTGHDAPTYRVDGTCDLREIESLEKSNSEGTYELVVGGTAQGSAASAGDGTVWHENHLLCIIPPVDPGKAAGALSQAQMVGLGLGALLVGGIAAGGGGSSQQPAPVEKLIADAKIIAEDTAANGNVLANDTAVNNSLSVVSFKVAGDSTDYTFGQTASIAGVGTITIAADGDYIFTPVANWNGTVPQVTYTTNTGSSSTLDITVTAVDDASVLVADTNLVDLANPATGNVLSNDTDIDSSLSVVSFKVAGDSAVYTVGQTASIAGVGTVTIAANGAYSFVLSPSATGSVPQITYTTNTGSSSTLDIAIRDLVIQGTVAAGEISAGVTVFAYDATGALLGSDAVDAKGFYEIIVANKGGYRSGVLVRAVDTNDATTAGTNFLDETTGQLKDLSVELRAADVVHDESDRFGINNNFVDGALVRDVDIFEINITPVTELATRKLGLTTVNADPTTAAPALPTESIAVVNKAIGDLFGVADITAKPTVITDEFFVASTDAGKYGLVLAALSGADALNKGNMDATVDKLEAGLKVTTSGDTGVAAFTPDSVGEIAKSTLVNGAIHFDTNDSTIDAKALDQVWTDNTTLQEQIKQADALSTDKLTAVLGTSGSSTTVSGKTDPGAFVRIVDTNGTVIPVQANAQGYYETTLVAPQQDNKSIIVTSGKDGETSGIGITTLQVNETTDTVAPQAPIVNPVAGGTQPITGKAEPGSTVTVYADGEIIGTAIADPITGVYSVTPDDGVSLPNGADITVKAKDADGNVSLPTAATVVPTVNFLTTNDTTPTINGTAVLGSGETLSVTVNGQTYTNVPVTNGNWSLTLPTTPDGTYPVTAEIIGANGAKNPDVTTNELIIISAVAPTAPTIAQTDGNVEVTLPVGVVKAEVSFTPDTQTTPQTVTLVKNPDTGLWNTTGLPVGSTVTEDPLTGTPVVSIPNDTLKDDSDVEAVAIDAAGNRSPLTELEGIDATPTTTPVVTQADGEVQITVPTDAKEVVLEFTPADDPATPADESATPKTVTIAQNPNGSWPATVPGLPTGSSIGTDPVSGNPVITIPNTALESGTPVEVTAIDPVGNESTVGTLPGTGTVDNTAPTAPTVAQQGGDVVVTPPVDAKEVVLVFTPVNDPATTVDESATPKTVIIAQNPNGSWPTTAPGLPAGTTINPVTGVITIPNETLAEGKDVEVTATDAAGNQSPIGELENIDTTAPTEPVLAQESGDTVIQLPVDTEAVEVTFTPAGTTTPTTVTITKDPVTGWPETGLPTGSSISADPVTGLPVVTIPNTELANGTPVTAIASDPAGNESNTGTLPGDGTVDATAPDAPIIAQQGGDVVVTPPADAEEVVLKFTPVGGAETTVTIAQNDNGSWPTTATGLPTGTTIDPVTGTITIPNETLADETPVTATAVDAAGNENTDTLGGIDTTAPTTPTVNPVNGSEPITGTADVGSTVTVTYPDGTTATAIATPTPDPTDDPTAGVFTITPSKPLADGQTITLVASDPAGNTSPAVVETVDASAPNKPSISQAEGNTTIITPVGDAETLTVTFTPEGATTPTTVTLTKDPLTGWPSINDIAGLPDGSAIAADGTVSIPNDTLKNSTPVTATAADEVGNTSAPASINVDTLAPNAPTVNPLTGGTAPITGIAEPGSTVSVTYPNGTTGTGTITETVTAGPDGKYSVTPDVALKDGATVTVSATDPAGNESTPEKVTVDAPTPSAPSVKPINAEDPITGTAAPGSTVTVTYPVDSMTTATITTTAKDDGTYSVDPSVTFPNGATVTVSATDPLTNAESAPTTAVVDAVAPLAPTLNPLTSGTAPITGTAEPGSTVKIWDTTGTTTVLLGTTTAAPNGAYTFTPTTPLTNGAQVTATATDPAGNTSGQSPEKTLTSTATAPTVLDPIGTADPTSSGTPLPITGTALPGSVVTLTSDEDVIGTGVAGPDGTFEITPSTNPTGTITATAKDAAGTTIGSDTETAFVRPTISIDATLEVDNRINAAEDNDVVISGKATGVNGRTITVTLTNSANSAQTLTASATVNDDGTWSMSPANINSWVNGDIIVTADVTDASNNAAIQATKTLALDNLAPNAPVVLPTDGRPVVATAEPGSTVKFTYDNGTEIPGTVSEGPAGTFTLTPSTTLANGTVVKATATDAAGNSSSPSAPVTVDSVAPNAPAVTQADGSVNIDLPADATTAEVTFTPDGTTTPTTVTLTKDPVTGEWYPAEGTDAPKLPAGTTIDQATGTISIPNEALKDQTPVTATAIDAAGNVSDANPAADGSQPVSVTIDTAAPDAPIVSPVTDDAMQVLGTAPAGSEVVVTFPDGSKSDPVTADADGKFTVPVPAEVTLNTGDPIVVTATDPAGNESAPAEVTVNAGTPLTDITAPDTPIIDGPVNGTDPITGTAEPGTTVKLLDSTGAPIKDANGTPITALVNPDGTYELTNPGLTDGQIKVVATDAAGNTTTTPAVATVDATGPSAPTIAQTDAAVVIKLPTDDATTAQVTFTPEGATHPITVDLVKTATGWVVDPTGVTSLPVDALDSDGTITLPKSGLDDATVVTAVATDAAGNDSQPATTTVDDTAPTTPTINPVNANDPITGTAEPGSVVKVTYPDANGAGGTNTAVAVAGPDGKYSVDPSVTLPNGATVTVSATDAAGNTSPEATKTVDATAPTTPTIAQADGDTTVTLPVDAESARVTFTPAGANTTPVTVDLVKNAQGQWVEDPAGTTSLPTGSTIDPVTGEITIPNEALKDASDITTIATDAAGNSSTPAPVTIDAAAPAAPVVAQAAGKTTVTLPTDTDSTTAEITFTNPDGTVETVTLVKDQDGWPSNSELIAAGLPIGTTIALIDTKPVISIPNETLKDSTPVTATAADEAGNTSVPGTLIVDTKAPAPSIIAQNGSVTITPPAADVATVVVTYDPAGTDTVATIKATQSESGWTATGLPTGASINSTTGVITLASTDFDATEVKAVAVDAVGNESAEQSTLAPLPTISQVGGDVLVTAPTTTDAITVTFTPVGSTTATPVTIVKNSDGTWPTSDAGLPTGSTIDSTTGAITIPGETLKNGSVVTATATENNGTPATTDDNISDVVQLTIDTLAPNAPTINPTDGSPITGTAEPGTTVTVSYPDPTNGGETITLTTTANENGVFTVTPTQGSEPANGATVTAKATDAAGNASDPSTAIVDATAPTAPLVNPLTGGTAPITGIAEPGSVVAVTYPDGNSGTITETVTAGPDGKYSVTPDVALKDGATVTVSATDPAGNVSDANPNEAGSQPVAVTVDAPTPSAPSVNPINAEDPITGTAPKGSVVTLKDATGTVVGSATADPITGEYTIPQNPANPLVNGEQVNVTATDPITKAVSTPATAVVDPVAPDAPLLDPVQGGTDDATGQPLPVTGSAEPGSIVTLLNGAGQPIGSAVAGPDGSYSVTPSKPLLNGDVVLVTATDAAGNESSPTSGAAVLDDVAPLAPTIDPINATDPITGTAEPGSTVTVKYPNGSSVVTQADPVTGEYSVANPGLTNGQTVTATATDDAGNNSPVATEVVDTIVPVKPAMDPVELNPVQGGDTYVTGTAEPGSTVTVSFPDGSTATTTAGETGAFAVELPTSVRDGQPVTAVATDVAGNTSAPGETIVGGVEAPAAPTITSIQNIDNPNTTDDPDTIADDGTTITGVAAPGSTVQLKNSAGTVVATATADAEGDYTLTTTSPLTNAVDYQVVATKDGLVSDPTTVTGDTTVAAPVVTQEQGTVKVALPVDNDATQATVTYTPDGSTATATITLEKTADGWSSTTTLPQGITVDPVTGIVSIDNTVVKNASTVTATVEDAMGNVASRNLTPVDTAIALPVVDPINATDPITGSAEKGSTVRVVFPDGSVATTTADATTGVYEVPNPGLTSGEQVQVTAVDAAGNVSQPATGTADTTAPAAPQLNAIASTDTLITGTAQPGSTVTVTFADGTSAIATANESGAFVIPVPDTTTTDNDPTTLHGGDVVTVKATDPAGNVSPSSTKTVAGTDTTAPDAPVVNPVNGSDPITGTAEPGSVVTVTYPTGEGTATATISTTANADGTYSVDPSVTFPSGASVTVSAKDAAGNTSSPATKVVDAVKPTVTISDDESGTGNIVGGAITYTFTFSEAVTGFTAADIVVANGTKGTFTASTATADVGKVYTLVVTPTAGFEGNVTVDVAAGVATDLAGNANTAATQSTQAVDMKAPTAVITMSDTAIKNGETSVVTITFSEGVSALNAGMFTVANGGLTNFVQNSTDPKVWTATFTPDNLTNNATANDPVESLANVVTLNAAYQDVHGNQGVAATSDNFSIDTKVPSATIALSDTTLALGDKSVVSITFSEAVTGFSLDDLSVTNGAGTLSDLQQNSVNPLLWTAVLTPNGNTAGSAQVVLSTAYADAAGNVGETNPATFTVASVDSTPPVITITSVAGDAVNVDTVAGNAAETGLFDAAERGALSSSTVDTKPVISGTTDAEVGRTVSITLNGKTYTTQVVAGTTGGLNTWSTTLSDADAKALNHGSTYGITATVADGSGNVGSDTSKFITANIAPPDVPTVVTQYSTSTTPVITGMAQKESASIPGTYVALETGDLLSVTVNGVTVSGTVGAFTNNVAQLTTTSGLLTYNSSTKVWSLNTSSAAFNLVDNSNYDVSVSVVAGGIVKSDISTTELFIKTTPPTVTLNTVAGDDFINKIESGSPLIIGGTVSSDVAVGSIVTITGLDNTNRTAIVQADRSFSTVVPSSQVGLFTDGVKQLKAEVTNVYSLKGNDINPVTVDLTPPVVNDIPDITATSLQTMGDKIVGTVTEPGSSVLVSFPGPNNTTVNATVIAGTTAVNGQYTFEVAIPNDVTLQRNDKITFVATDKAGNVGLPVIEYYDPVPIISNVYYQWRDGARGPNYSLLNAGNVIDQQSIAITTTTGSGANAVTTSLDEIVGTTIPYATVTMAYTTAAGVAATKTATADEFGNYSFDLLTGKMVDYTNTLSAPLFDVNALGVDNGTPDNSGDERYAIALTPNDTSAQIVYKDASNNSHTITVLRSATGVLSAKIDGGAFTANAAGGLIDTASGITLVDDYLYIPKTTAPSGISTATEVIPNAAPERVVPEGQTVTVTEKYTYSNTAPASSYREVDDGTINNQNADYVLIRADFNRDVILELDGVALTSSSTITKGASGSTAQLKVQVGVDAQGNPNYEYADFNKVIDNNTLEFKLIIQPGWTDLDGISIPVSNTQVGLSGGATDVNHNTNDPAIVLIDGDGATTTSTALLYDKARSVAGEGKLDAWLDYTGTAPNENYKVDTTAPVASITIFGVSTDLNRDPYSIDGDNNPATSTAPTELGDFNDEISATQYSQNQGVWIGGKVDGEYRAGDKVTLTIRYMDFPAGYNQQTTVPTASTDPTSNTVTPQMVEKTITVTADVQADGTWKTRMWAKDLAMDADLRIEARLDTYDEAGNRSVTYDTHQYTLGFFNIMSAQGMNDLADVTTDTDKSYAPNDPDFGDTVGGNSYDTYGSMNTTTLLPFLQNTSNFGTGDEAQGTLDGTYDKNVNILTDLNWGTPYEYMRVSSVMFEGETYNPDNVYSNTYNYIDNASWGDKYWTANHFVRDGKVLIIANDNWHFGGYKYDTETKVNPYRWYDGGSLAAAFDFVGSYDGLTTDYAKGIQVGKNPDTGVVSTNYNVNFIDEEELAALGAPADAIAAATQILEGNFGSIYGASITVKAEADTYTINKQALTANDIVLAKDDYGNAIIVLRQHGAGYVLLSADQDILDSANISKTSTGDSVNEILAGNLFAWADQYGSRPVNATVDFASRPDYQYWHLGGQGWYYYRVGDTVSVKLTVKGQVAIDTTNGTPTIDLEIANDTWQADYNAAKTVYNARTGETTLVFDFLITDQVKSDYWNKVTSYSEGIHLPGNGFDANGATVTIDGKAASIEYNDFRNSYEPYPDGWLYNPYQMVFTDPARPKAVVANGGLGFDLSSAGDFNGDGYEDFFVTEPGYVDSNSIAKSKVYVVYGSATGLPETMDFANLKASQGIVIDTSATGGDNVGYRMLESLGDFNGDGYDDIMMTDHYADSAVVIWGGNRSTTGDVPYTLSTRAIYTSLYSTKDGFRIDGDGSWWGSAGGTGDYNGDGYADIVVSNAEASHGKATVIYGGAWQINTTSSSAVDGAGQQWMMSNLYVNLSDTATTSGAWKYVGPSSWQIVNSTDIFMTWWGDNSGFEFFGDQFGSLIDANGDGIQDLVVSDPYADVTFSNGTSKANVGSVWVIYGQAGKSIGDGVVSATNMPTTGANANTTSKNYDLYWKNLESMVASGKAIRIDGTQENEALGGNMAAGTITGSGLMLGRTIASLGDINGDGYADMAVSSPSYGNTGSMFDGAGRVYVLYGSAAGTLSGYVDGINTNNDNIFKLDKLASNPNAGFMLQQQTGTQDTLPDFGYSMQGMGDINGDGIDDYMISAPEADSAGNNNVGAVYLIWGSSTGLPLTGGTAYAESLVAAGKAVKFEGANLNDYLGTNMAIGDWDGDGLVDFVIPRYAADTYTPNAIDPAYGQGTTLVNAGTFDIYYGSDYAKMTQIGSDTAEGYVDTLTATNGAGVDRITGGLGNDTITGIGAGDVAYGGAGNDTFAITSTNFTRVDGGLGIDTLQVGEGLTVNLAALGQKVQGIESFVLGAGSKLELRLSDVINQTAEQSGTFQAMRVDGTSGTVDFAEVVGSAAGQWSMVEGTGDAAGYNVYHNSSLDATNHFGDVWIMQGLQVI